MHLCRAAGMMLQLIYCFNRQRLRAAHTEDAAFIITSVVVGNEEHCVETSEVFSCCGLKNIHGTQISNNSTC